MRAKPEYKNGERVGILTVVSKARPAIDTRGLQVARYKVKCDCGATKIVRRGNLLSGNTRSCGCQKGKSKTKTAISYTPMYRMWRRVSATRQQICKEWQDPRAFCQFFEPLMEHRNQKVVPLQGDLPIAPGNFVLVD